MFGGGIFFTIAFVLPNDLSMFLNHTFAFCAILDKVSVKKLHVKRKNVQFIKFLKTT